MKRDAATPKHAKHGEQNFEADIITMKSDIRERVNDLEKRKVLLMSSYMKTINATARVRAKRRPLLHESEVLNTLLN